MISNLTAALLLLSSAAPPFTPRVTPVRGTSWIRHLGVALDDTHMGRMGGEGHPPSAPRVEPTPRLEEPATTTESLIRRFLSLLGSNRRAAAAALDAPFTLVGQDLYRLDCQSCHGPGGLGAPPEIGALIDPVRATSPTLLEQRQRAEGRSLPPGMASQLAADAELTLRDRIANGGKKMPPFRHLAGAEVDALVDYLKALAGLPAAELHPHAVTESVLRAGEHLAKGTCHICHPATGPGASHLMMTREVIPSLASMPEHMSPSAVVEKVRRGHGAGMGMMGGRSRMPVLSYLTDEETLAAYLFLSRVPPEAR